MTRLNWQHAVALAVLLVVAPAVSHAAESYDNCTGYIDALPAVIASQGTWCLRHDLTTSITSGHAISVLTNNVTIDCNDFKLGGLAAGAGTTAAGIYANQQNTTVRHCNIRGFFWGLSFTGSGHIVEDNRFDGNTWTAMDIEGDGSVIRRNRVFDTGGSTQTNAATGIIVLNSADVIDNTVSGVTATGNGFAIGINTQSNPDGTVSGNHVRELVSEGSGSGGATMGIYNNAVGTSGRVTFRGNDVVGDSTTGSSGLVCAGIATTNGRARDNVISGFATGISGCSNDSGNVVVP